MVDVRCWWDEVVRTFLFCMRRSELRLFDISFINTIQRAIWYPYFDDMDAIIFLAPISCFDERLVEDKRVNRLEDTYMLWKTLCGLKLLAKTQIILFLNKVHSCPVSSSLSRIEPLMLMWDWCALVRFAGEEAQGRCEGARLRA